MLGRDAIKSRAKGAGSGAFETLGTAGSAEGRIQVTGGASDNGEAPQASAPQQQRPRARVPQRSCRLLAAAAALVLACCLLVPTGMFTANTSSHSLAQWLALTAQNTSDLLAYLLGQGNPNSIGFVVNRYLVLALAGAALGMSGAVYQGSLRNALASPTTLGVMSGATCGATLYALLFVSNEAAGGVTDAASTIAASSELGFFGYLAMIQGQAIATLLGALVIVAFVVGVAYAAGRGRISGLALIITGQVVMGVLGGINTLVRYYMAYTAPDSPQSLALRYLQNGALDSQYTVYSVIAIGVPVLLCFAIVMLLRDKINLLAFDEAEAWSMGVNVNRLRFGVVALTTVLTAVVVAFCGAIGFIGFFVPHLARRVVGPNFRHLLPASALVGAAFLMLAYFLAAQIGLTVSSAIGIFTSLIGGAVFIAICMRERGSSHDGWM